MTETLNSTSGRFWAHLANEDDDDNDYDDDANVGIGVPKMVMWAFNTRGGGESKGALGAWRERDGRL